MDANRPAVKLTPTNISTFDNLPQNFSTITLFHMQAYPPTQQMGNLWFQPMGCGFNQWEIFVDSTNGSSVTCKDATMQTLYKGPGEQVQPQSFNTQLSTPTRFFRRCTEMNLRPT